MSRVIYESRQDFAVRMAQYSAQWLRNSCASKPSFRSISAQTQIAFVNEIHRAMNHRPHQSEY